MTNQTPTRVKIVNGSPTGYFKPGQYAYILSESNRGGLYAVDIDGTTQPGEMAYLVSKTKGMVGGALWFTEAGVKITARKVKAE